MADAVLQDMLKGVYHRRHYYEGNGRRFSVYLRSDRHGYSGSLVEYLPDGFVVPAGLSLPPQCEINPTSFYKERRRWRAALVKRINEELDVQRVIRLDAAGSLAAQDPFIRANLEGWPKGYPEVVEDDLTDWIDVKPHWYRT
ncbi:hypothetical protein K8353_01310 [Burkholderia contaminans]|nr:hypothetical protein [Burkholderia contaminans]